MISKQKNSLFSLVQKSKSFLSVSKYRLLETINEKESMNYGLPELINLYVHKHKVDSIVSNMKDQIGKNKYDKKKYEKHIKGLYGHIKIKIIKTEEDAVSDPAHHYFQKEGKLIRPLINFSLAELLFATQYGKKTFKRSDTYAKQKDWASIIEILHISSLVHDDILDKAPTRRGLKSTHEVYGTKNACFGADFMMGRGVQKISDLEEPNLFQVYATIMDNLTSGEYIQAKKNKDYENIEALLRDYIIKSYYKTGSLISNSCRGVCLIAKEDHAIQKAAFKFGQHIGIAFQLIDDILDYTRTSQELGKEALSDLKEGVVTGPILFAIQEMKNRGENSSDLNTLIKICNLEDKSNFDIKMAAKILNQTNGIEKTRWLAYLHAQKCLEYLETILRSKNLTKDHPKIKEPFENLTALIFHVLFRQN